ncbi:MAG: hypothetical protein IPJ30_12630 [Acidobacteria bacterium]|nr:hypothetical protein [Acidobacteriota bacterium]
MIIEDKNSYLRKYREVIVGRFGGEVEVFPVVDEGNDLSANSVLIHSIRAANMLRCSSFIKTSTST